MRIVPIIKAVGIACNLKCRYCWFNPLDQTKIEVMTLDLLEKLVRDYAIADDSGSYQFIWHGGEPLLAGVEFFQSALKLQKLFMAENRVKNVIQTNGTLLSPAWVRFFFENDFKVGISLDGQKELHDAFRVNRRGRGSHDRIMANLVQARELGLKFSVIATISSANVHAADEIFRFFVDNGITSFGFNMVFERGPDGKPLPFSITNEQYAEFQCRIFDLWLERNDRGLRIREFDILVQGLLGLPVRSCHHAGTCERFINVGSNGDVFPCERLTDAPRLGNLRDSPLGEILEQEPYTRHCQTTQSLPQDCRECRFLQVCHNGCTHHRVDGKLHFCEARKTVFRHVESRLEAILGANPGLRPLRVVSA
ncbi:MAG: radical SAM protein [Fimbriimonadaceae bacterium]|nr:radical SAM protein [Fimbriimonadaceae bacterium]